MVDNSPAYYRFLQLLTSLDPIVGHRGKVRRFRPGLDYTVAHYGIFTEKSVLDGTLCFCKGDGAQVRYDEASGDLIGSGADEVWSSGDAGGFECYIAAEEEEEGECAAVDEYNADDDSELLSVSASFNTLSLCYRNYGTMRFVKYVNGNAPGSRWDISLEYEVEDDGEDGEAFQDEDGHGHLSTHESIK